jgi:glutathione S-transferase
MPLKLVSHKLCPYVQRAVIALTEKGVAFERVDIDLAKKPDWFLEISPLGKTPVLLVGDTAIFESAVILEYLEETQAKPLHPAEPLARAEHRGWIEFGSAVLNDIAGLYSTPDEAAFNTKASQLEARFARLEMRVAAAPWFDGDHFSLVDAVFAPVFRYFDLFDEIAEFGATVSRRARRCEQPWVPIIRPCCAVSSPGGIPGCPAYRLAPRRDRTYNSAAIRARAATVFMLRAVPVLAAGTTSFDFAMPSP